MLKFIFIAFKKHLNSSLYVLACLGNIKTAMDKQHENLFSDDVMDITAEMEVMNMILKGEGLLEDSTDQIVSVNETM